MNLLDRRKAGLIQLLALFLFACESDNIISLPFDPKIENINAHYTELTLPFRLVQIDSINTTNRERILVGNYLNDSFGNVKAIGFTDFNITNRGAISSDDVFDSLSLIVVNDYYYGEAQPTAPQTFSVYQLTDTLARRSHYSFESVPYDMPSLGSIIFEADPKAASSNDTIHIRLSDVLGEDLFEKAKNKTAELSTDSAFREYFKGVAIVPESENNFITGFDLSRMRMVLYFSEPDETVSSTYTFALNSTVTFSNIQYNRAGTPIANINEPGDEGQATNGKFYMQSGTGLSPMIDFQPLLNFINNIKYGEERQNILLNRVDLYIGFSDTGQGTPPPAIIKGFEVDENFNREIISNSYIGLVADNSRDNLAPSAIEPDSLFRYKKGITKYMQALADSTGSSSETEFLFLADDFEYSVSQLIVEPDSIKLQIYYTILK